MLWHSHLAGMCKSHPLAPRQGFFSHSCSLTALNTLLQPHSAEHPFATSLPQPQVPLHPRRKPIMQLKLFWLLWYRMPRLHCQSNLCQWTLLCAVATEKRRLWTRLTRASRNPAYIIILDSSCRFRSARASNSPWALLSIPCYAQHRVNLR